MDGQVSVCNGIPVRSANLWSLHVVVVVGEDTSLWPDRGVVKKQGNKNAAADGGRTLLLSHTNTNGRAEATGDFGQPELLLFAHFQQKSVTSVPNKVLS